MNKRYNQKILWFDGQCNVLARNIFQASLCLNNNNNKFGCSLRTEKKILSTPYQHGIHFVHISNRIITFVPLVSHGYGEISEKN